MERYRYFTALITKINRNIKRIKSEEMSEFELKGPHVSCLYYLYTTGGTTASEICEMSEDDKATISRSIDYLEEIGLVNESGTDTKKYNVTLSLTEKGLEVAGKIAQKIERILDIAGTQIKDKKRKVMYECLMSINENLENIVKGYDGIALDEDKKKTKAKKDKAKKKEAKKQKKKEKKEKKTLAKAVKSESKRKKSENTL